MEAFTARNVAKFVIKTAVSMKTAQLTEEAITDHTKFEEDDIIVHIGGGLVGWYVADKLKPITDSVVDKTADKIVALRANRAAKKETEEEK